MALGATSHRTNRILLALLAGLALASPLAAAERASLDDPFEITADRIDYDGGRDLYVATGQVRVLQKGRSLSADWVAFSRATRIGVAEGGVELLDGTDRLDAEFMVFDIDSLRGMLFQGGLDAGSTGFRIRAAELVRTGENSFTARDGVFSTCRCEPGERLPWQISAREADIEVGDYGTVRNATFDVLGVPVLWIPWAFFPIKSDRETGLLLPDIALGGRGGMGGGLPFFWAADDQLNVIVTPRYLSRRGYKQDLEFEYVFGERSEGELFLAAAQDRFDEPSGSTQDERWAVLWRHDHSLPAKWRWFTDLKLVSDNVYADDYRQLASERANRFLESTSWLGRGFGASEQFGVMLASRYADDQQGVRLRRDTVTDDGVVVASDIDFDFQDGDDTILQRFAEVRADVQPGSTEGALGLDLRFDAELIQFGALRRHESVFDSAGDPVSNEFGRFQDVGRNGFFSSDQPGQPALDRADVGEGDGRFEPGERIAERGTRAVVHPRIARRFSLGRFAEFEPEVGWSQTLYHTDHREYAGRGLLTARAELRSRLLRDYVRADGSTLRHIVEPRVGWALVSKQFHDDTPNFVPQASVPQLRLRGLSLENITRNPSDRVETANRFLVGLSQRFYRRRPRAGLTLQAELVTAVDYDLADGGVGEVLAQGRLFELGPFNARIAGAFDPEAVEWKEAEVELNVRRRFRNTWVREFRAGASYRYQQRIPTFLETDRGILQSGDSTPQDQVNQVSFHARIEFWRRFRVHYRSIYSLVGGKEGGTIRNEATLEYASKCRCWAVGVTVTEQQRQGIGAGFQIRFLGLGDESGSLFGTGFGTGVDVF